MAPRSRSLSKKGWPYDNSVTEAMFKVFKNQFANGAHFLTLEQLNLGLHGIMFIGLITSKYMER